MGRGDFSIFEKIDLFGKSFEFTFEGKGKFKSKFGGYFTILTLSVVLYCAWVMGNEILYRNLPKDYQIEAINLSPRNLTLKVPFAFMIQDSRGNIVRDYDRYLIFEAYYYNLYRVASKFENVVQPKRLSVRKCKRKDFSEELKEMFTSLRLEYGICLDNSQDNVLGGDFNLDFAKFVTVEIRPCYNTTMRPTCAPKHEIFSFLNMKNIVISLKHERLLYVSRNFSSPIRRYIAEDNILIDPYILNFPRYLMEEFSVDTDKGIIGTDNFVDTYYQLEMMSNDIITAFDEHGKLPNLENLLLYEYSFFESSNGKIQVRSYLKLTEVVASLGGILKIYLMIFSYLFQTIYQRIMYEKVITRIFNFEKTLPNYKKKTFQEVVNLNGIEKSNFRNLTSMQNLKKDISGGQQLSKGPKKYGITKINIVSKMLNKGRTSVLFKFRPNKDIRNKQKKTYIFSILDHIIMSFCPCFSKCSKILEQKKKNFYLLVDYTYYYIDILLIMKHFYELERLKLILFNKKQLAIFQNIPIPKNPLEKVNQKKFRKKYDFLHDEKQQKLKCLEFFSNDTMINSDKVNQRLHKYYAE